MCFPRTLEMLQLSFSVVHCTFTSCPHSFYSISNHTISVLTGIFVEFYLYLNTVISGIMLPVLWNTHELFLLYHKVELYGIILPGLPR